MCYSFTTAVFVIILYIQAYDASILKLPTTSYPRPSSHLPLSTVHPPSFPQNIRNITSIDEIVTDGKDHPCYRECDGRARTCYYHFSVEWYQSMSKACFDCPFNITDCGRKDCVAANGVGRPITVINRKMPGPSIEVCQNDTVIVDVENHLMASGTTIHWHGVHQKSTPFMDGTPFVTQCPIQPESTFRYEFKAVLPGTFFWHSHIGLQRGDGVAGTLIIRQEKSQDPHGKLYDYDKSNRPTVSAYELFGSDSDEQSGPSGPPPLTDVECLPRGGAQPSGEVRKKRQRSEHTLFITDWSDQLSLGTFTDHYHAAGGNTPTALLINGVGRFDVMRGNRSVMMRAPRFDVVKGSRYRFRLINAEFFSCPVEMSVDGHNITVIASDGSDLEPATASSLVSYAGERFDFIITADKKVDNYWIRIRGLMGCNEKSSKVRQVGVLHYEGAKDTDPSRKLSWDAVNMNGLQINSVNQGEEQNVTMTISKLKSLQGYDDSLKPVPDHKFYISYDMYAKDNPHFHKLPYYGYHQVKDEFKIPTPQLNQISMKLPTSPLLVSRPPATTFCNESSIPDSCKVDYCQCSHVLSVKLHSVVEVIIIDEGAEFDTNHPFHLHGYSFRVVGQRRLDSKTTVDKVKAFERAGLMTRNLKNPPIKDTVTVPDGGYTIIRFKADNPGYWLFHCHIEFHAEVGMALVFKVGEHEDMKPVPKGFPSCGNFANGGIKSGGPAIVKDINSVSYKKN